MSKRTLSKKVFEVLVRHLVDIEEKRVVLLNRYYPDMTKEREAFESLFNTYLKKIEEYISNAEVADNVTDIWPFIMIGSIVELENLTENETETYHIVSPFESSIYPDMDFVSFLSPVGKTLLLKEEKDIVTIQNPMGQCTYRVRYINVPDAMLSYIQKEG